MNHFKVFFREEDGSLGRIDANKCYDHEDAIKFVQESFPNIRKPFLVFIKGEKND